MSITILKPGVQTTIQDIGRYGYSHFGISSSGAADLFSFRLGNIIVGNPEELAGIEMTLLGGDFKFNSDAVIAVTGSSFNLSLDSQEIPYNQSIYVKKNQILSVGITKGGARSYLLVKGGIKTENYLNSKTTHVMSGMGGFMGRPLKKGDILEIDKNNKINITNIPNNLDEINTSKIRINKGLQSSYFSDSTWAAFTSKMFTVSEVFSRMGIRLKGNPIHSSKGNEILTEGIPLGAIQVPGGGEPIISFVEHQTTGGYPKIANVISADLCKVGQLKPGDKFQFELISFEDAEILRLEQEAIFNN
jgi:biotin-dependent carboxylase-like uncharacterized protein|tara:strand:+ start:1010 stop:1921 length:912 start_codon:yes stop_codon:yes gene_type:complete